MFLYLKFKIQIYIKESWLLYFLLVFIVMLEGNKNKKEWSVIKLVIRNTAGNFTEFKGQVVEVAKEQSGLGSGDKFQYHIKILPTEKEIKGNTGFMHEWLPISATASDNSIPEGSILDKYITEIELLIPKTKLMENVDDVMQEMVGKTFLFVQKKLGRSFSGYDAKQYWCVRQLLSNAK